MDTNPGGLALAVSGDLVYPPPLPNPLPLHAWHPHCCWPLGSLLTTSSGASPWLGSLRQRCWAMVLPPPQALLPAVHSGHICSLWPHQPFHIFAELNFPLRKLCIQDRNAAFYLGGNRPACTTLYCRENITWWQCPPTASLPRLWPVEELLAPVQRRYELHCFNKGEGKEL